MTLLQRYLSHYVAICQRSKTEKANAWALAQQNAEKYPDHLADLPQMLTAEMRRLQAAKNAAGT